MGRFKAAAIIIREIGELRIIFYDTQSIYVYPANGRGVIFNRWFAPRGSYGNSWHAFRRALLERKNLTLLQCHEIAAAYDIAATTAYHCPDLTGKKIRLLTDVPMEKEDNAKENNNDLHEQHPTKTTNSPPQVVD